MTVTDIQCDQCGQRFQPKRVNKAGPCYCGNACRQKAHRLKAKSWADSTAGEAFAKAGGTREEQLAAEVVELRAKASKFEREAGALRMELFNKTLENDNLRRYNKAANTRMRETQATADLLISMGGVGQDEWERLATFDDSQLRNWVKVGLRMARNGNTDVIENSIRHVEGNRVPVAALRGEA